MSDKPSFTFCTVPKERYDTMLSIEEQFAEKAIQYRTEQNYPNFNPSFIREESIMVCSGKEDGDRPAMLGIWSNGILETRCRYVYTTSALEVGKEYPVIVFPKTCSAGLCFVKESQNTIKE